MIISLCTLLDIIMSLFKFVTNPAEPFQPWRIGCQAGDLYRDGHPLTLTEDEQASAYFQYLIIISSLIKVEEAPVEETKVEEASIEENNTVDDIVKVEETVEETVEENPRKGKKG